MPFLFPAQHDIDPAEWTAGLELWAKEYLKGEDPASLVPLKALEATYKALQLKVRWVLLSLIYPAGSQETLAFAPAERQRRRPR